MNRTITYLISDKDAGFTIEQNLRHRGYSAKNITLKKDTRKCPVKWYMGSHDTPPDIRR